jgi:hypothetical protein
MRAAHDLISGLRLCHDSSWACDSSIDTFLVTVGVPGLLETGKTIQELNVDAFRRGRKTLPSSVGYAERRPLSQLWSQALPK